MTVNELRSPANFEASSASQQTTPVGESGNRWFGYLAQLLKRSKLT